MRERIEYLIFKIKYSINYLYYFIYSISSKNFYPYTVIGEKINLLQNGKVVRYKTRGQENIKEIFLHDLLRKKELVEGFHPLEAIKLGSLAFEDIIFELPESQRKEKFNQIKNTMLNSTHDVFPNRILKKESIEHTNFYPLTEVGDDVAFLVRKNSYPCKLVGSRLNLGKNKTIIVFTILGRKEGYEKPLKDLIANRLLLGKFHPTEAIKFGFIFFGDTFLESSETKKE